jgi:hypothetical protein
MHCRPYYTEELNMVQAASLLINVFTLFVGIMLIIDTDLEASAMKAGETYDQRGRTAVSIILFLANLLVILVPLVIFWSSSGISITSTARPDATHAQSNPTSSSAYAWLCFDSNGAPGLQQEQPASNLHPAAIADEQPISSSDQLDAPGPSLEGDTIPDVIGDAQPISSSDQSGRDAPGLSLEGDTIPDVIGDAQPISSSDQSGQDAPGLSLEGDTIPDVIGDAQPISSSDQSDLDAPGPTLEGDTIPDVINAQPISSSDQSGQDAPGPSLEGDTIPDVHPDSEAGEGLKGCQQKTSNGDFLLSATLPERDGSKMEISNCESFRACPAPATLLEIQGSEAKENADGCNKQSQKDLDAVASAGILGCCEYYESDVILAAQARSSDNDDLGGGVVAPTGARTKHDQPLAEAGTSDALGSMRDMRENVDVSTKQQPEDLDS